MELAVIALIGTGVFLGWWLNNLVDKLRTKFKKQ